MIQAEAAFPAASTPSPDGAPDQRHGDQGSASTREKILGVALDLFIDQGFDGTSIREIAGQLHISKPAIYYHFASKEEILLTLHMRLHESGKSAFARLSGQTVTLQVWDSVLSELLDQMAVQRKLFLMAERNQAALEKLHRQELDNDHDDIRQWLQQALADPSLSLRDRVRMACSLAAVLGGPSIAGQSFSDVSPAELAAAIRDAVHDLLADRSAGTTATSSNSISTRRGRSLS